MHSDKEKLRRMMEETDDERVRNALRTAMQQMSPKREEGKCPPLLRINLYVPVGAYMFIRCHLK